MKGFSSALVIGVLVTVQPARGGDAKPPPADVVFKNGIIYTANDRQPRAEAVAVKGDRLVFVGSSKGAKAYEGAGTKIVDLRGRTVLPGLADAHVHLSGIGQREMKLNLEDTASLADMLERVKARVAQAKPGQWVTGRGWIETFWKPQAFPTRWDLDKIAPANPVFLTRADGHGGVGNSAALKIAGIDRKTASPFGGEILKDAGGEPNGMLLDKAQGLVGKHIPATTEAEIEQALLVGARRMEALGWTQVHIAGNSWTEVDLLRKLYREGKIKLRIYDAIRGPGADAQKLLRDGASVGELGNRLTVRTIKITIDGALGSRGAALLAPYSDYPTAGFLTQKEAELSAIFAEALRRGIQIEVHAIGDRANRVVLDLYEKAFKEVPAAQRKVTEPRWRVEHAQIVHPADLPRFARLKVIPSMQPSHAISDLHFATGRLGVERLAGGYAWRRLVESGVQIAGGSDAPVERGEPMIELYAAIARKDQKGFAGPGWNPEQAVSRDQALKMFTLWAAAAAFEEGLRGSLEPGKLADMTVLSSDVMKVPEAEILKTRCLMTVIGGEVIYEAADSH